MIRYNVSIEQIEARVDFHAPGWMKKAHDRTESFRLAGRYQEASAIWSAIKPAFMEIQFNKCAYCERRLEGAGEGATDPLCL